MSTGSFSPKVIIVGGGIGGMILSILLEHAQISYVVLERSNQIRQFGSAIGLGPNVFPLLDQLGLLDEIMKNSKRVLTGFIWNEKFEVLAETDHYDTEDRYGYFTRVIARPKLDEILAARIPAHKIHRGKRVLSFTPFFGEDAIPVDSDSPIGVTVVCADNTKYHGDILVGADGVYSAVRQNMFQRLEPTGSITDAKGRKRAQLPFNCTCLVGETHPNLDDGKYDMVTSEDCVVGAIIGDNKPYSWTVFSMPGNSICWMVTKHLKSQQDDKESVTDDNFRCSDWGTDMVEAMIEDVRDFPVPCGKNLTMGDLIDASVKENISKVMLEEKLFDVWYSGRTVLLGDGAVTAIQDAAVLADLLYHLKSNSQEDITRAFETYYEVRYAPAKRAYRTSYQLSQMTEQAKMDLEASA
ncbi:hypothetical protein BGX28_009070 [Mortierella sp. GBA30]|nr:hypothetical protein BGX28_009070 [Mortierella sp. GBA30]